MTRLVLCVVSLIVVFADGCGEKATRGGGAGETAPSPRTAPQTITERHSGESFMLARGSETRLQLSAEYVWSEPTVRGQAVELARVDYFQDPGFSEWSVLAVQPGKATIAVRGTPACTGRERCPDAPLRFQTDITVAP